MAISMLKIRRPLGRLIFNMGIAIPGKTVFLIETAPWRQLRLLSFDIIMNKMNVWIVPHNFPLAVHFNIIWMTTHFDYVGHILFF